MKKTLLLLSAVALSGTAILIAQEGDRDAPRGNRRGGMFSNAPLFKALGINAAGEVTLPKADDEKAKAEFLAKIIACDKDKDGKLSRTEMFGERRGRGGDRRRDGGGGGDRPRRPASE